MRGGRAVYYPLVVRGAPGRYRGRSGRGAAGHEASVLGRGAGLWSGCGHGTLTEKVIKCTT
eukprot:scaffold40025_cov42-Phaeocystis_antarctica.AAC.6